MRVSVAANVEQVMEAFKGFESQAKYAISRAINAVAKDGQAAQRKQQRMVFTVRRPAFVDRAVKIKPFATKSRLEAVLQIDPPGGRKRADILTKFEEGGTKRSTKAGGRIALPVVNETRISKSDRRGKRPRDFEFVKVSERTYKAPGRVFMIRNPDGTGGIYKRLRSSRRKRARWVSSMMTRRTRDLNIQTLYRFTPSAKIDDRLHFEDTITKTVRVTFKRHFEVELRQAITKMKRR